MNVHTNTHTELKKGFVVVVVIVLWGKECGGVWRGRDAEGEKVEGGKDFLLPEQHLQVYST